MYDTTRTLKTMTPKQAAYYTGKRVDSTKWEIPDWYGVCRVTAKMYPESAFWDFSFPHHAFTREQLDILGPWGVGWVEHADYLSEEGYYQLMDRVEKAGYQHFIDEYWDNQMTRASEFNRRCAARDAAKAA